jgi:hypothetical protein
MSVNCCHQKVGVHQQLDPGDHKPVTSTITCKGFFPNLNTLFQLPTLSNSQTFLNFMVIIKYEDNFQLQFGVEN